MPLQPHAHEAQAKVVEEMVGKIPSITKIMDLGKINQPLAAPQTRGATIAVEGTDNRLVGHR